MKILRFDDDRIGILDGDEISDVSDLISHREYRGPQGAMEELIAHFDLYRPKIEAMLPHAPRKPLAAAMLRSPLARPGRVLAAFVNYWNSPQRSERKPIEFFHKSPHLVGPGSPVELPDIEAVVEFQPEAELAFVIGTSGRNISKAEAMNHIFGYIPYFDISARGMSRKSQFLPKGQDGFSVCGPWITTAEEITDPHDLIVKSWTNDQPRQNFSTSLMVYNIPEQISWLSRFVQLRPGDMVATGGFHEGLGAFNAGDTIAIEITGLGRASFPVTGKSPHKVANFKPGGGAGINMTPV